MYDAVYNEEDLSFAYKFPFSKEAKAIMAAEQGRIDTSSDRLIGLGRARLDEALKESIIDYKDIRYGKLDYLVGYAYARLLVSATSSELAVKRYVSAEAERARRALEKGSEADMGKLAAELHVDMTLEGTIFRLAFSSFLRLSRKRRGLSLTNFRLHGGFVFLGKHDAAGLMVPAMENEIGKGLPIKAAEIPKPVFMHAKGIQVPRIGPELRSGTGSTAWIDRLLNTPIPDVRHRVVNLILAPYLVNVRGLGEEEAFRIISSYIERCKALDPNTLINDPYIRYQCKYAKRRGLKPLSLARARELLGSLLDFGTGDSVGK